MRELTLSCGTVAKVSNQDFKRLSAHKWYIVHCNRVNTYARAKIDGKWIYMHRYILGVTDKLLFIDHRDGDGLNNQRKNLRPCNTSQNCTNRKKSRGSSQYIGVTLHKRSGLFHASVYIDKKYTCLGYFKNELAAAKVRDAAAKKSYGKFAKLNFA